MGMTISVRGCPTEMDMGWGSYSNLIEHITKHIVENHGSKCLKGTINFLKIETNDKTLGYLDCRDVYKYMLKYSWKNRRVMWFT